MRAFLAIFICLSASFAFGQQSSLVNIETGEKISVFQIDESIELGGKELLVRGPASLALEAELKSVKVTRLALRSVTFFDALLSDAFLAAHEDQTPFPNCPEPCVEVVSPLKSRLEMLRRRGLYFAQGAKEVWFSHQDSSILFYNPEGELAHSELFPDFPKTV